MSLKAQQIKKQATVDQILSAALQVFAESGFEGARIDEIAARAGVNKAMIYYHIGDKQALYDRVLTDVFSDTADRLTESVAQVQTPVNKLKAYIRNVSATFTKHPLLPPIMMRELASGGRNLPADAAADMLRVLDTVSGILKQGRKQKVFIRTKPLVLHMMVIGTMTYVRSTRPFRRRLAGSADRAALVPDSEDATALLAEIEKLVLRAIRR
jgi:AcrR family transcriptional regulator